MKKNEISTHGTALVFNDMINSNLRTNAERSQIIDKSGLIPKSAEAVSIARERNIPIVWITVNRRQDGGDTIYNVTDLSLEDGWAPKAPTRGAGAANVDDLPIADSDFVVLKPRVDPFFGTNLDFQLRRLGIDTILLGGFSTVGGVEAGARTACDHGYNVVVLSDCCYWVEDDVHQWALKRIFPRFARVLPIDGVGALLRG